MHQRKKTENEIFGHFNQGSNLKEKVTKRSYVSKYETRRVNDLQVPRPRLEMTRKSISHEGAKVWNCIPNNIRKMGSPALFKKQVANYYLGQ